MLISSDKSRIPAWCDRILWKGPDLRQIGYGASDMRLSDHHPVWATFTCIISIVDETRKESLRQSLHAQQWSKSQTVGTQSIITQSVRTDDNVLIPVEPTATGLPPPSSEIRKWWLDNGQCCVSIFHTLLMFPGAPVKSSIRPPAKDYILNEHRTSNPFSYSESEKLEWVPIVATQRKFMVTGGAISRKPLVPPRSAAASVSPRSLHTEPLKAEEHLKTYTPPVPAKPSSLALNQSTPLPRQSPSACGDATHPIASGSSLPTALLDDDVNVEFNWQPLLR